MKKFLPIFVAVAFLFPAVSFASTLTTRQVSSIVLLLEAFGVDAKTITSVKLALNPSSVPITVAPEAPHAPTSPTQAQVVVTPSPTPQFTQYPTFESAAGDQLRVSWRTNISSESWMLLCSQNPKQYGVISTGGCIAQTNNNNANPHVLDTASAIPTSGDSISDGQYFATYIPAYHSPMFYVVEIGANGKRVDYGGQIPQL